MPNARSSESTFLSPRRMTRRLTYQVPPSYERGTPVYDSISRRSPRANRNQALHANPPPLRLTTSRRASQPDELKTLLSARSDRVADRSNAAGPPLGSPRRAPPPSCAPPPCGKERQSRKRQSRPGGVGGPHTTVPGGGGGRRWGGCGDGSGRGGRRGGG